MKKKIKEIKEELVPVYDPVNETMSVLGEDGFRIMRKLNEVIKAVNTLNAKKSKNMTRINKSVREKIAEAFSGYLVFGFGAPIKWSADSEPLELYKPTGVEQGLIRKIEKLFEGK
jgi:hypothetical protein